jgi:hypothetical protein
LAGLFVIALLLHWRWFLPGVITDQDWWNYSNTAISALWPIPSTFNFDANVGADWRTSINYFPMESLMGLLAHLGADFSLAERVAVLFPTVVLAPVAAYVLLRLYCPRPAAAYVGALFYANNAYIDVIIARGQMTIAESYAMAPLVVYCAVRSIRSPKDLRLPIATAMAFAAAVIFDVRIALLTACLTIVVVLFELHWTLPQIILAIRNAGLAILACLGLLCFVWLPIVALHLREAPPLDYASAAWIARLTGPTVWDLLTAYHPLWYSNVFSQWQPFYILYFVLLIVGLASLVYKRRKRIALCLAIIICIATLFAAAGNTLFGHVYEWLFVHTWFIGLFRDPSKFYAPAMLSYSLCIGVAATELVSLANRKYAIAVVSCIAFIALFPTLPAATGQQAQLYLPKQASPAEARLAHELANDVSFSRVLWVGAVDRIVPGDYRHPSLDMLWLASVTQRNHSVARTATSLLRALKDFGVDYVVLRRDTGEGLDYEPNRLVYNTIRMYALFGAFGEPAWSMDGLTVFRLRHQIAALPDLTDYALPTSTVPELPPLDIARQARESIKLAHHSLMLSAGKIALPTGLSITSSALRYDSTPLKGGLWTNLGAAQITAIPPLRTINMLKAHGAVVIRIPDWTGYVMIEISAQRAVHGIVTITGRDFFERHYLGLVAKGRYYFTFPVQDAPKELVVTTNDPRGLVVTSARRIAAEYYGLVATAMLRSLRHGPELAISVPIAAEVPRRSNLLRVDAPVAVTPSPAELKATVPAEGSYSVPFAYTALWTAPDHDAHVVRPAHTNSLTQVRTTTRAIVLTSAADPLLRKGAVIAVVVWALLAVLITTLKLRDMSVSRVQAHRAALDVRIR